MSQVASSGAGVPLAEALDRPGPVTFADYPAVGVPGAYFRWVPGRHTLAYEADGRVYLLDLEDGQNRIAPGFIDFVPTPDGRYFVTPAPRNAGLAFFEASEVFGAAYAGRPGDVRPIAVDDRMRDQYPSVGILAQDETSVRYRVLTSWFEGLLYRDYEVRFGEPGSASEVSPLGAPVVPCAGMALSTPIMSQDGTEVAAREEASGTTKIYRILPEGRCEEALALGMPTRKVAWHQSGRKLAFSTPRVRSETGRGADPGIFVYDRDERRLTRIADSEGASQLAFPDFVGDDAVVFMVPDRNRGGELLPGRSPDSVGSATRHSLARTRRGVGCCRRGPSPRGRRHASPARSPCRRNAHRRSRSRGAGRHATQRARPGGRVHRRSGRRGPGRVPGRLRRVPSEQPAGEFRGSRACRARLPTGLGRRPIAELLEYTRSTMPDGAPESLTSDEYEAVIAYLVEVNGGALGGARLRASARCHRRATSR